MVPGRTMASNVEGCKPIVGFKIHPELQYLPQFHSPTVSSWNDCVKEEQHNKIMSLEEFQRRHHSDAYPTFKPRILQVAKLVVRIRVKQGSKNRPSDFPFCNSNGGHAGTGFLYACHSGQIWVATNKHVIYDTFEADQSEADFFYDTDNAKNVISCKLKLYMSSARNLDFTILKLISPPASLLLRLKPDASAKREWENIGFLDLEPMRWQKPRMLVAGCKAFSISHPHGGPKRISFGQIISVQEEDYLSDDSFIWYWHNIPTCQGSSGAPIFIMSNIEGPVPEIPCVAHIGYKEDGNNVANSLMLKNELLVRDDIFQEVKQTTSL